MITFEIFVNGDKRFTTGGDYQTLVTSLTRVRTAPGERVGESFPMFAGGQEQAYYNEWKRELHGAFNRTVACAVQVSFHRPPLVGCEYELADRRTGPQQLESLCDHRPEHRSQA